MKKCFSIKQSPTTLCFKFSYTNIFYSNSLALSLSLLLFFFSLFLPGYFSLALTAGLLNFLTQVLCVQVGFLYVGRVYNGVVGGVHCACATWPFADWVGHSTNRPLPQLSLHQPTPHPLATVLCVLCTRPCVCDPGTMIAQVADPKGRARAKMTSLGFSGANAGPAWGWGRWIQNTHTYTHLHRHKRTHTSRPDPVFR